MAFSKRTTPKAYGFEAATRFTSILLGGSLIPIVVHRDGDGFPLAKHIPRMRGNDKVMLYIQSDLQGQPRRSLLISTGRRRIGRSFCPARRDRNNYASENNQHRAPFPYG